MRVKINKEILVAKTIKDSILMLFIACADPEVAIQKEIKVMERRDKEGMFLRKAVIKSLK